MLRSMIYAALGLAMGSSVVFAAESGTYLDGVLSKALGESIGEFDERVAVERATRDARAEEGKKIAKLRNDEFYASWRNYEAAKRDEYAREREEERLKQLRKEAEREERIAAAEAQRARDREASRAATNATIMEAINRAANNIASAQIQGQTAVNNAYAQANAINAARRAEADAKVAAARQQQEALAANQRVSSQNRVTDAAREAEQRIAALAKQSVPSAGASSSSSSTVASSSSGVASTQNNTGKAKSSTSVVASSGTSGTQKKVAAAELIMRKESVAHCYTNMDMVPGFGEVEWRCDGPVQKTVVKETLAVALQRVGCDKADVDHRRYGWRKGYVFYCENGILSYDRDVASILSMPGKILAQRHTYQCRDKANYCDTRATGQVNGG
ncbi:hypothetical protein [Thalassospira marina]|uniref:Beta/gamma crystallin 'Greek key' domain-containing protein n=1 Tax=Thalassospira marina TaxID=2048283 RepID=A0ABM6Q7N1_9PROT|nr:hypothetical protein [Thalassospira marina]AUG52153.1 hypothetical protein CSC3H3_05000 [Thalassospira marina]